MSRTMPQQKKPRHEGRVDAHRTKSAGLASTEPERGQSDAEERERCGLGNGLGSDDPRWVAIDAEQTVIAQAEDDLRVRIDAVITDRVAVVEIELGHTGKQRGTV